MGLSNYIPVLREEIPQGVTECTIADIRILRNTDSDPIMYLGSPCIVFSFSYAGLISEKAFRLGDHFEHKAYKKLLAILGVPKEVNVFNNTSLIGKNICVFIQKLHKGGEVYFNIVNFKPPGKDYSFIQSEVWA